MRKETALAICFALCLAAAPATVRAHCQIPCGIYGDDARFQQMEEHVRTIEKSMQQIQGIGAADEKDWNQLVRWVENKDTHADALAKIVTGYFLQQRIKPFDGKDAAAKEKYRNELTYCHEILVHAMKAKQTTDPKHVAALRDRIRDLAHSYLGEAHEH